MTKERDHEIFDAVVMSGETCSAVADRVGLCSGRVGAIVFEVARRRNPHEYKRIVANGERSLRSIRASAVLFPRKAEVAPKCAEGARNAMREAFESALTAVLLSEGYSAFSAQLMFERGSDGEYRSIRVNGAWWGWQASREGLIVRLPDRPYASEADQEQMTDYEKGLGHGGCETWDKVRQAVETQGLKVKP